MAAMDSHNTNAQKQGSNANKNKKKNEKTPKGQNSEVKINSKEQGKFVELPGAEMGKVVVRFPPEASGYLHIGHAKAALLNQHYQLAFNGRLIMRFDDTNPAKEKEDFEKVILEDVELLRIKPDTFTYTSDYFDKMLDICENIMLKKGLAYVDNTDGDQMRLEREQRVESVNRNNSIEKNLEMWKEMVLGSEIGQKCCVRAKIDMQSANGCLRDPTIYRCKPESHPRTSDKYKVYPTYDFACPIVDSLEGVTHCLRTTEYADRDQQFYWFCDALKLGSQKNETRPYVWSYSRLNMTNTVLSKRKLTWFVEQGHVDGWDDPRMPTVRGVLRRGMQVEALKQFIVAQGSSRTVTAMQWDKIWSLNRSIVDSIAPRHTALLVANTNNDNTVLSLPPVEVVIENVDKAHKLENVPKHPKNPELGSKNCVWGAPTILIDYSDAELLEVGSRATFINWGNILINRIERNLKSNKIEKVFGKTELENTDFKSTIKVTWLPNINSSDDTLPILVPVVCVYFDHLVSKAVLAKDDDFKNYLTEKSRWELQMIGDSEIKDLRKGEVIQLQRRGYFICDSPYQPYSIHTGKETPAVLFSIPDGHTKSAMPIPIPAVPTSDTNKSKEVSNYNVNDVISRINEQGDKIRGMKYSGASKSDIGEAVKVLLALKAEYKSVTGKDFPAGGIPTPQPIKQEQNSSKENDLISQINEQGNKVRTLKSSGASKSDIGEAVKVLLSLKADYKSVTGKDFPAGGIPIPQPIKQEQNNCKENNLISQINEQGNKVRTLKSSGASKSDIGEAVKVLLELKAEYKSVTGKDFPAGGIPTSQPIKQDQNSNKENDLITQINEQGNKVRTLKSSGASKSDIGEAVKVLLSLKADYKSVTGKDFPAGGIPIPQPIKQEQNNCKENDLISQINEQGNKVRTLKSSGASKSDIGEAVKVLLELKAEYKSVTGKDFPAGGIPTSQPIKQDPIKQDQNSNKENDLITQINEQGNKVRTLKSSGASKSDIGEAVKVLLALKAEYKSVTGKDFPAGGIPTSQPIKQDPIKQDQNSNKENDLITQINEQGNKVRTLKSSGASKSDIGEAVKVLLALKAEYKSVTGKDFPAGGIPTPQPIKQDSNKQKQNSSKENYLISQINEQGNKVRTLKSSGASKSDIGEAVKVLLALKAEYKSVTGKDFPAGGIPTPQPIKQEQNSSKENDLISQINEQGNKVRTLKSSGASKADVEEQVKMLLALKIEYKSTTGKDYQPPNTSRSSTAPDKKSKKKENTPVVTKATKPAAKVLINTEGINTKKVTKLGLEVPKLTENLGEWYSQVLVKGEMIEYYDVSGCYVLRPWAYGIWELIQQWLDSRFKRYPLNVRNCYFPIFVSKAALEKEKEHIADFAPEVAWVTKSGDTELAEYIAIRPTSETVMYPAFAKWIQSYRDLPLKLNQWNNVVRWEFKHPQPFLRTREFLWQEGHHAYATQEEAEQDVLITLDYYEYVYKNMLAVPVIKGKKTEKEKFAGGVFTTTCEAYIASSGRAIQGATSHYLGTNFARMFDVHYEHPDTHEQLFVHQISYGMTTRTIGVMVMVHGDDRGLILPPRVATVQVIIVPCGVGARTPEEVKQKLIQTCVDVRNRLRGEEIKDNEEDDNSVVQKHVSPIVIRADTDLRENYSPGWKFNHWELKGVPLRLELGPKDLDRGQMVAVRRDNGEKLTLPLDKSDKGGNDMLVQRITDLLNQIQQDMLAKAEKELKENVIMCRKWSECSVHLAAKQLLLIPFCGRPTCEDNIKRDTAKDDGTAEIGSSMMGAKSLCVPFEQPIGDKKLKPDDKCIHPECGQLANAFTLFGRSY